MSVCPRCQQPMRAGATECEFCRAPATQRACPRCGQPVGAAASFCGRCGLGLRADQYRICPTCAHPNRPEADFCVQCSSPMVIRTVRARCEECGWEKQPGDAYCTHCGAPGALVGAAACSQCGGVLEPGDKHCGHCGAPNVVTMEATAPSTPTNSVPASSGKESASLRWTLLALLMVVLIGAVAVYVTKSRQAPPAPTPTPMLLVTTSKGVIEVGKPAYADGRSLGSEEPATVLFIPVLDEPAGAQRVCNLPHGAAVQVTAVQWVEAVQSHYFQIVAESCPAGGWVMELYLGDTAKPAVGAGL